MTETTLEWLEFHNHLQDLCHGLLENQRAYADCVLKTQGKAIYCHRVILSASSDYLKRIFEEFPYETVIPEIVVPEISYNCLQSLIYFIYHGEILSTCKDLNELWDAATLLDIKSMKSILDGFFTQTQFAYEDTLETLDTLVKDLHATDNGSMIHNKMETPDVVEDIHLELIDELIPIVPVGVVTTSKSEVSSQQSLQSQQIEIISQTPHEPPPLIQKKVPEASEQKFTKIRGTGKIQKRPIHSLAMLREKAIEYQKQLESAVRECKKGMSLDDACKAFPNVTKETLYRNIKNFKLPHIKPPE